MLRRPTKVEEVVATVGQDNKEEKSAHSRGCTDFTRPNESLQLLTTDIRQRETMVSRDFCAGGIGHDAKSEEATGEGWKVFLLVPDSSPLLKEEANDY